MRALLLLLRLMSFVLLSMLAASALMYCAPGYLADAREMDATHAPLARPEIQQRRLGEESFSLVLRKEARGFMHGDLGTSRQYEVPVGSLLRDHATLSLRLLGEGIAAGWCAALLLASMASLVRERRLDLLLAALASALLAVPVGALATFSLLGGWNAPAAVLALLVGVRDFKVLHRVLQTALESPHVLHARAQGLSSWRILITHLFPQLRRDLATVALVSFTLALSATVPVEVIFDSPGLGHLAWTAAMNRDLPVLVATTGVLAFCVGAAATLVGSETVLGDPVCA